VFVVDTNVLVYAANRDSEEHERCRALLELWRAGPAAWYTTWSIVYEFVRVVTHPRVFGRPWPAPEAWRFVEALFQSPGLGILVETARHPAVAAQVLADIPGLRGNLVYDARTAILMREHGIRRIYTRDTDFHRFPFVEVLDPLAAPA
jgi:toxin-antitoxin system PIN domain toxin